MTEGLSSETGRMQLEASYMEKSRTSGKATTFPLSFSLWGKKISDPRKSYVLNISLPKSRLDVPTFSSGVFPLGIG